MVWFRIDDAFPGHPKLDALLDDPARWSRALAVWVVAGCYASRYTTDGRVRTARLARECSAGIDVDAALADLLEVGLLDKVDGDLWMHDFLQYNPTASDVKADREAAKVRKQKSRDQKRQRNQGSVTQLSHRDTPVTVTGVSQPPDPTRPDPTRPSPTLTPTGGVSAVADDIRIAKHAGDQLGATVTAWLNQRLNKRFDKYSKVARAGGARWRRAGWKAETVQRALALRITELELLKSFSYLLPGTLYNTKLGIHVERHEQGVTPAVLRGEFAAKGGGRRTSGLTEEEKLACMTKAQESPY